MHIYTYLSLYISIFLGDDKGLDSIIQAMKDSKTMEQKEIIFKEAISSPYFYFNAFQAQILFDKGDINTCLECIYILRLINIMNVV
jgi:hypothetical protein